jgi:hypothetical protein
VSDTTGDAMRYTVDPIKNKEIKISLYAGK